MFILCKRIGCPLWESDCQKYDDTEDCHMSIFDGVFSCDGIVCFDTATLQQESNYKKFNHFYLMIDSFGTKVPFPKPIDFVKLINN